MHDQGPDRKWIKPHLSEDQIRGMNRGREIKLSDAQLAEVEVTVAEIKRLALKNEANRLLFIHYLDQLEAKSTKDPAAAALWLSIQAYA